MVKLFYFLYLVSNSIKMKYILLLFLSICSFAQDKFKVEYERRYFISLDDPNPESKKLREEMFSKPKYIALSVDANQCLSQEVERVDNSQGPKYSMKVIGGYKDLESFYDFENNSKTIRREMDSKIYNISDSITTYKWNITRETKKIKGYDVRKAIVVDANFSIEAWYVPTIKSKCGPEEYNGLPGLLLELKRTSLKDENQYTTYKLESISVDDKLKLQKPSKGKVILLSEFEKLEGEYYQKIQENINKNRGVDRGD